MHISIRILLFTVFFLVSCKPSKTVSVKPVELNSGTEQNSRPVYRSSRTKVFDLVHTSLKVNFNWKKRYMYGVAEITLHPHFYPDSILVLDARGFQINSVAIKNSGAPIKPEFLYRNDSLIITLDRTYNRNEDFIVVIDYVARPDELESGGSTAITNDKGLYFINPDGKDLNKPMQIWTQGETQAASAWFPTIDAPNQKMTQDITITVDSMMQTLSNGLLVKSVANLDGTRTDIWKQSLPHAPYLAMMVIGEFSIIKDKWRDKEVSYYVEPYYSKSAAKVFAHTPAMLEFFSNLLGVSYPWEKYAQIVVRDYVSGSMENTSATLHGEFMQMDERQMLDFNGEEYISHELFHQWFGDLVTCESWSNIPLNESFASYGEYLWSEFHYGREFADYNLQADLGSYLREAKSGRSVLIRFNYDEQEDMFDRHSYEKGACILHMLRKYLGDDAFFSSLKLYLTRNKFKSAEVHDLRLAFEDVTGEDLNWFFNQWFLDKGHPELDISYQWNESLNEETVVVKQLQDLKENPLYRLPLLIDIYTNGKVISHKVILENREHTFKFKLSSKPLFINFDAEKMLLCTKVDHHTDEEWAFLYENGKLYIDRSESLIVMATNYTVPSIQSEIVKKALADKSPYLRTYAINNIGTLAKSSEKINIRQMLVILQQQDGSAQVRNAALKALLKYFDKEDHTDLLLNAVKDSSYRVSGTALLAYTEIDLQKGLSIARSLQDINNRALNESLMPLYSTYGSDKEADYMKQMMLLVSGFDKYQAVQRYSRFLQKINDESKVEDGVEIIYDIAANDEVWFIRAAAIQALLELKSSLKVKNSTAIIQQIEDDFFKLRLKESDTRVLRLLN
jgi:aminopeptidase N